jgi:hypothetical protein
MNTAFDMPTEVANLAERIVGPVAAKVAQNELDTALSQIRHVFEELNNESAPANVDCEYVAIDILEPVRAKLSEADFARIVDRLRGAMVGFCQRDEVNAHPDAEAWTFQQTGEQSEPANAGPWWNNSEQAVALLILLWLYTGIDWSTDLGSFTTADSGHMETYPEWVK